MGGMFFFNFKKIIDVAFIARDLALNGNGLINNKTCLNNKKHYLKRCYQSKIRDQM